MAPCLLKTSQKLRYHPFVGEEKKVEEVDEED
jgi:hypothetical protein